MNLVIPIASNSRFFNPDECGYPKPLIEIMGTPMIELVIKNITQHSKFSKIVFIVKSTDCDKYHLDNTLRHLSPVEPIIIKLKAETKGALCSVLLAIEHINTDEQLIISNADQVFDSGVDSLLKKFSDSEYDAGCLTFSSVHPRWSFVKTDANDAVVETAEKNPISKNAIAGFYMYKKGAEFIQNGMSAIKHGYSLEGQYYLSTVFNEYVLQGKKVGYFPFPKEKYHTFYSPQKIEEYESKNK